MTGAGLATFEHDPDPAFDPTCDPSDVTRTCVSPALPDASTVKFYHGDHLGTTRFMTDATGAAIQSSVYSAFGMRVSGTNHRYGYDHRGRLISYRRKETSENRLDATGGHCIVGVGE